MKKVLMITMMGLSSILLFEADASVAFDSAADAAYSDGWQDGDNGGSGFGGWIFGGSAAGHASIQSSTVNGGLSSIDSAGVSFSLLDSDNSGNFIDIFRYLNTDLQVGETFSMDMDINWRGGYKGFRIRDADDATSIFQIEVGNWGDGDATWVSANGSDYDIGRDYSDNTQYHISLEQTSAAGGIWAVTRSGGLSDVDSGAYSGTASSIQLYSGWAGSDIYQGLSYNNLSVIPEPSTLGMVGVAGIALLVIKRRI